MAEGEKKRAGSKKTGNNKTGTKTAGPSTPPSTRKTKTKAKTKTKTKTKRATTSRDKLAARLDKLADGKLNSEQLRAKVLECLRVFLDKGRGQVRDQFRDGTSATEVMAAYCSLIDQLVGQIFDFIGAKVYPRPNPTTGELVSIVAVGGYGRGELAPHSDIDLLFLLPYKKTPHTEQVIEYMLYLLWDLGLKVGHATRSINDCIRLAKSDVTISTSMLEARRVCGDADQFTQLRQRFTRQVMAGTEIKFVEAKLTERDERHRRMGGSRYVLEPNVKEGKGGLRDLHTLFWIAKYVYRVNKVSEMVELGVLSAKEADRFAKARNFLSTVRCHLHLLTDRAEDRLTFNMQGEVGHLMGYTDHAGAIAVERFMKHYFLYAKEVGDLTRIFCAAIEAQHRRKSRRFLPRLGLRQRTVEGFEVEGDRVTVTDAEAFTEDPVKLISLFLVAHRNKLDIHPQALRLITRNLRLIDDDLRNDADANRAFMDLLTAKDDPEFMLRRMNEAGVFGRFIPEFGRVVAQMQHDMYHVYTVDEHTLFALGILHRIECGELEEELPLSTEIIPKIQSRPGLYLALLLHDIGKGRGGNHSEIGAEIALRLGPRLGLSDEETETASWLVRMHLAMSNMAFKRDIGDPQTVRDFVEIVQSPERLRLLVLLTVADIRAVGPKVWNGWKAALLRDLYYFAEDMMSGGLMAEGRDQRVAAAKDALRGELSDWRPEDLNAHITRGYPSYWLSFDTAIHAHHARLIHRAEKAEAPLTIDFRVDDYRSVTDVTVYVADQAGLFSLIAGAIAVAGGNILDAKIFTLANGMVLDSFSIQDAQGASFLGTEHLEKLRRAIENALAGQLRLGQEIAERQDAPASAQVFTVTPRVLIDNDASASHSVIEVKGADRPGFLYDITRALTELNLQISSAKISTFGVSVIDVFYVKDLFGLKITHEDKLAQITKVLTAALKGADAGPAADTKTVAKSNGRIAIAE
ncbi:MAG: [protein-PII] uridylyltransferase [Alphaproteobacteria bacterium]